MIFIIFESQPTSITIKKFANKYSVISLFFTALICPHEVFTQDCISICDEIDFTGEILGEDPCSITYSVSHDTIQNLDYEITIEYSWFIDGLPIGEDSSAVTILNSTLFSSKNALKKPSAEYKEPLTRKKLPKFLSASLLP